MLFSKYIDITPKYNYAYGSGFTCSKPTKDRKYVKTLAACKNRYATMKEIYPDVKNPLSHEVARLQNLGLLKKYTMKKYIKRNSYQRVWYKTTKAGNRLLESVGL